jgi:DNA-binding transcriptional LysR family regulator
MLIPDSEVRMDLKKLHHCVVVADLGSFTRAASLLAVPQSVLSRQVRDVEGTIGLTLLRRTGRGVLLTEAGERILPGLRFLVAEGQRILEDAHRIQTAPTGIIRLGVLATLGPVLLTPLLNLACERLPGIRIHVLEGLTDHLDEMLVAGRLDVALLYNNRQTPTQTDEAMLQTDLCLVSSPDDPHTAAPTIALRDLRSLPLTLPAPPNRLRAVIDQVCRSKKMSLKVTTTLDAIGTLKDLAASGRLYTILPPHCVAADVANGRLAASRIVDPSITRTVLLATSNQYPNERALKETTSLIREVIIDLIHAGTLPGRTTLIRRQACA